MKARRSEVDGIVNLLIQSFKEGANLPFTIPTKTCPDLHPSKKFKKKKCRKRHSEIVVGHYIEEGNKYHLFYFGMHTKKIIYEYDQEQDVLISMIKKSLQKKKIGGKTLLEIRKLKKILKTSKINRNKRVTVRFTEKEFLGIQSKARIRNLEITVYMRMKLFS